MLATAVKDGWCSSHGLCRRPRAPPPRRPGAPPPASSRCDAHTPAAAGCLRTPAASCGDPAPHSCSSGQLPPLDQLFGRAGKVVPVKAWAGQQHRPTSRSVCVTPVHLLFLSCCKRLATAIPLGTGVAGSSYSGCSCIRALQGGKQQPARTAPCSLNLGGVYHLLGQGHCAARYLGLTASIRPCAPASLAPSRTSLARWASSHSCQAAGPATAPAERRATPLVVSSQATQEEVIVHPMCRQQLEQLTEQGRIFILPGLQAEPARISSE